MVLQMACSWVCLPVPLTAQLTALLMVLQVACSWVCQTVPLTAQRWERRMAQLTALLTVSRLALSKEKRTAQQMVL